MSKVSHVIRTLCGINLSSALHVVKERILTITRCKVNHNLFVVDHSGSHVIHRSLCFLQIFIINQSFAFFAINHPVCDISKALELAEKQSFWARLRNVIHPNTVCWHRFSIAKLDLVSGDVFPIHSFE